VLNLLPPGDEKEHFDHAFIRKLAPKRFDSFDFVPSMGASGGILVGWNSSIFRGQVQKTVWHHPLFHLGT